MCIYIYFTIKTYNFCMWRVERHLAQHNTQKQRNSEDYEGSAPESMPNAKKWQQSFEYVRYIIMFATSMWSGLIGCFCGQKYREPDDYDCKCEEIEQEIRLATFCFTSMETSRCDGWILRCIYTSSFALTECTIYQLNFNETNTNISWLMS